MIKSWRMFRICGRIQNLGGHSWNPRIMRVRFETVSFGYDLIFEIWIAEGPGFLLEDLLILQLCPLEENVSHHYCWNREYFIWIQFDF